MMAETIASIGDVLAWVERAAEMARASQSDTTRAFKADGSVVTEADDQVEAFLFDRIAEAYPQANVLTEETAHPYDPGKPYTFAIDPVDGTDVYSQGMAGWCVSVGLLDRTLTPVAGVIAAPRLELLLFADVGEPATLNGEGIKPPHPVGPPSSRSNLMVTSRLHRRHDLSRWPGKIRSIGSAALHLCFPLLYPAVYGAVEGAGTHIWDVAGAHAIVRSHGLALELLGGGPVDYAKTVDGGPVGDVILAGHRRQVETLRGLLEGPRPGDGTGTVENLRPR